MQASEPNAAQRLFTPWSQDKAAADLLAQRIKPTRLNRSAKRRLASLAMDRAAAKKKARELGVAEFLRVQLEGVPSEFLSSHQRQMRALAERIAAGDLAAA